MAAKAFIALQVCEVRYDRGYRYLDRCGDAMLVLEQLFSELTNEIWLPMEMKPGGARLKCPALDGVLLLDTNHLVVQFENNVQRTLRDGLFEELCDSGMAIVKGKFQVGDLVRVGFRTTFNVPCDSIADARALLMSHISPERPQNLGSVDGFNFREFERASTYVGEDDETGFTLRTSIAERFDAPIEVDSRLSSGAKVLPPKTRQALLDQLARRNNPTTYPFVAVIDVDHYVVRPSALDGVGAFIKRRAATNARILDALLPERHKP